MYHLKLTKALSYSGIVEATKQKPDVFVEDKAIADKAVATGYFTLVDEDGKESAKKPAEGTGNEKTGENSSKALEEMTMAELETYAAYHDVSLKGIRSKAAAVAKIKETLGAKETTEAKEPENEVDYGSPTMQELQGDV